METVDVHMRTWRSDEMYRVDQIIRHPNALEVTPDRRWLVVESVEASARPDEVWGYSVTAHCRFATVEESYGPNLDYVARVACRQRLLDIRAEWKMAWKRADQSLCEVPWPAGEVVDALLPGDYCPRQIFVLSPDALWVGIERVGTVEYPTTSVAPSGTPYVLRRDPGTDHHAHIRALRPIFAGREA